MSLWSKNFPMRFVANGVRIRVNANYWKVFLGYKDIRLTATLELK